MKQKTGNFLRNIILFVIEEIGPENVVQLVFDNASNYGLAGEMIMDKYPHIFRVRCAAHGVQLLLQDIYKKVQWVHDCLEDAKYIVDYLKRHGVVQAIFREFSDNELRKKSKAKKFESIIHKAEFWSDARDIISAYEPLILVLRLVDGDGSTSGYIYEAMARARESLKEKVDQNAARYEKFLSLFDNRKVENIIRESHAAAAYLNPALIFDEIVTLNSPGVQNSQLYLGDRLLSPEEKRNLGKELLIYDGKGHEMFNYISMGKMRSAHPRIWWEANGSKVPTVQKIVVRVLGQPCSDSATERNWSAFNAQTKKRNRLTPEMLEDIVFIRTNTIMYESSHEFTMRDRGAINLDALGELRAVIDDGRDENGGLQAYYDENKNNGNNDENNEENNEEGDLSWLDLNNA